LSPNETSWENSIIYGFQDFEESSNPFNFFMYKGGKSVLTSDTFVKNRTEMIQRRVIGSKSLSVADPTFIVNGNKFFTQKKDFYWSFSFNRTLLNGFVPLSANVTYDKFFKYLFIGSNYNQKISTNYPNSLPVPDQLEVMNFDVNGQSYCAVPGFFVLILISRN
jgi:hypothetical protein